MKKNGFGRVISIISASVITPIPGLGVSNTFVVLWRIGPTSP